MRTLCRTRPVPDRARWAWDAAGDPALAARSPSDIPQAADPVDVATGDVLLFQDDVSLPGLLPLVIGRAYRSSWRAGRWFGPSWASSLDQRLQIAPDRIAGVFADGRVLSWSCRSGEDGPVPVTGLPVTGPRWRLERTGGGAFMVTDPQAGLVWRFEGRGGELPLVWVTDRRGGQIRFGYTEQGEPAWITHSGGYRVRVVMSGGRVAELRLATPAGEETLTGYRYDPAGNLAGIVNGSGRALRLSYDAEGRLAGWQDRNGISYRYSYDEQGRCVAGAGPGGGMSGRFAYGDRVTWWTDAAGAVTIYQLDASSRVTAVTDPLGHVTHVWYDEYGCVSARADPLGRLTRYGYDERGNLTCITRPDGSQVRARYDGANLLAGLEDPDGARWRQEYDARGNLVRQIAPDQAVTSYGYDQRGHLASVTGPLGAVTTVECDPAGLPVAVTGPEGGRTRYTRDAAGRVTAVTAPDGAVTTLTWTADGLLAGRAFPDGSSERREYDAEGNLVAYLSPSGEQTRYEYGPFDQLSAVTGPDGGRTEFRYDHGLRLTMVTRGGLTWRYDYDAGGRVVAETDFNGAVTRYAYDPAGQLTSRVNAAGQEVTCAYDELGRLVRRVADGVVSTFGYDAVGRLVRAANPDAELRLTRDPLGRVTAETCNDRTVLSSYDPAGRRTRRVTPGGAQERWTYDDAGRPVRLESGGHVFGFGYDEAGRETRRDLPGGLALTQDWDAAGQLALQVLTAAPDDSGAARPWTGPPQAGSVLARRAYTYRADGYLAGVDDLLVGARRFTLDDGGRITEVTGARWAERYRYDPAGNVASARWSAPPPAAASGWLSADLQGPRDRTGTLITSAGTVRYRHDRQGRVIRPAAGADLASACHLVLPVGRGRPADRRHHPGRQHLALPLRPPGPPHRQAAFRPVRRPGRGDHVHLGRRRPGRGIRQRPRARPPTPPDLGLPARHVHRAHPVRARIGRRCPAEGHRRAVLRHHRRPGGHARRTDRRGRDRRRVPAAHPVGRHPVASRRRRHAAAVPRPVPRPRDRPALQPAALLRPRDGQLSHPGPARPGPRARIRTPTSPTP